MQQTRKTGGMKKQLPLLLISIPGLAYLLINNYIPMMGVFIAFKKLDYGKGIFRSDWIGFRNFEFLFKTNDAFIMVRNTLLYNLTFIILGTICAVFIAILMAEVSKMFCSRIFQAGLILPNLVSMVIVAYLVYAFLTPETGFVNTTVLPALGMPGINWYSEAKYWPFILVIVQSWKTAGYSSIVYIANIAGIDQELYEAAVIDGAGKLRQIFSITIPMLKPTIIIMVLMSIGRIFSSDFGLFYQVPMNSGALYNVTQTIDTYVYRGLMRLGDVGMSSAAGLFQSVVGFTLVMGANAIVRKVSNENALF
ncbi:sugar ABC transporter permease [Spirochaetia bacterium]|nr:sugar ABC transporter permease [Spirochaetia bacterium]